jgi:hypothetical protein
MPDILALSDVVEFFFPEQKENRFSHRVTFLSCIMLSSSNANSSVNMSWDIPHKAKTPIVYMSGNGSLNFCFQCLELGLI